MSTFYKIVENGFSHKVYTAKLYLDGQESQDFLCLHLKDLVYSTFVQDPRIMQPVDVFSNPEIIHVYDPIEGGTLAHKMLQRLKDDKSP